MTAAEGLCIIDDCFSPHFGHGWCEKHYRRWQRHGDPQIVTTNLGKTVHERERERSNRLGAAA